MENKCCSGVFIAFDGSDGSGKTTLIDEVEEILRQKVKEDVIVREKEPTRDKRGNFVKKLAKCKFAHGPILTIAAAHNRKYHIKNYLMPNLNDGKIVLSDRYMLSQYILQGIDGIPYSVIDFVNKGNIIPDLQVGVFADEETIITRMKERTDKNLFEKDEVIRKQLKFLHCGVEHLGNKGWNILEIDNNGNLKSNAEQIAEKILEIYQEKQNINNSATRE